MCGRSIDGYKATTKWQAVVCEGQGRAPATERHGGRLLLLSRWCGSSQNRPQTCVLFFESAIPHGICSSPRVWVRICCPICSPHTASAALTSHVAVLTALPRHATRGTSARAGGGAKGPLAPWSRRSSGSCRHVPQLKSTGASMPLPRRMQTASPAQACASTCWTQTTLTTRVMPGSGAPGWTEAPAVRNTPGCTAAPAR